MKSPKPLIIEYKKAANALGVRVQYLRKDDIMEDFKITKRVEENRNETTTYWYCNGIYIATCKVWGEYYCTVKNGTPSRIRNKWKKAYRTHWMSDGLNKVLGALKYDVYKEFFSDSGPDLKFGYQGSILNKKKIISSIEEYIKRG